MDKPRHPQVIQTWKTKRVTSGPEVSGWRVASTKQKKEKRGGKPFEVKK